MISYLERGIPTPRICGNQGVFLWRFNSSQPRFRRPRFALPPATGILIAKLLNNMALQNTVPTALSKHSPAINKQPDFFIVGAPKCGTTALAEYLSHHPDIFMARKEMHFFGGDLRFGPQIYCRDREHYLKEFDGWHGQKCAGEASVWYLYSKQAAAEIKAFNPEARIIIMIREPVEMLYSLYGQFRLDGNENLPTFERALAAEDDRRAGRKFTRHAYFRPGLLYRETARFAEQIRRYFDVFGRERVQVVIYDDFAADTSAVYRRVLDFMGLAGTAETGHFRVINGSQTVRSAFLRNLMSDPLVRGTAVAAHAWLPAPLFSALERIESWIMQSNIRLEKRPPLDAGLRLRLKREFAPEVERLSELLGRDLTHWSRPEPARVQPVKAPDVVASQPAGLKSLAEARPDPIPLAGNRYPELALRSNS